MNEILYVYVSAGPHNEGAHGWRKVGPVAPGLRALLSSDGIVTASDSSGADYVLFGVRYRLETEA